jgi:hypothetical protein
MRPLFTLIVLLPFMSILGQTKKPTAKNSPSQKSASSKATYSSDIRTLTDVQIYKMITDIEVNKVSGNVDFGMRIYSNKNFTMYFKYNKEADYSSLYGRSLNNGIHYKKMLSGNFVVYAINQKEMGRGLTGQPIINDFGEVENVFIYVKYHIVFKGQDEEGNTYVMCTRLYQEFDHNQRDRWYLGFLGETACCDCSKGYGQNKDVWIPGFSF